jgi:hypothetical protein
LSRRKEYWPEASFATEYFVSANEEDAIDANTATAASDATSEARALPVLAQFVRE